MRTRVKICGITSNEDARIVIDAGVDAIGLVFYEKSPRFVTVSQAAEISHIIPAFVSCVALFKDADVPFIRSVLQQVEIDLIQFHGSETAEFCEQFDRPYIKALGMKGPENNVDYLIASAEQYRAAKALLLDGHAPGQAGGTGETFDWSSIAKIEKPVVLAGGLTPENVKQAIEMVRPFAVDVSSGVESAPGIKDKGKVTRFMSQVMQQASNSH
jgi:phosphoribosylanthranilate isomerase